MRREEISRKEVLLYVAIASDGKTVIGSGKTPHAAKSEAEDRGYFGKTSISLMNAEIITHRQTLSS
ncbi:hypothetical protein A2933_02640 [Candidatus Nomurabacteria bacterium RIFCSPLOWO2_01_FULL_46_18]|uniref:Uncharacterized protein n=1 Tax=Candidatus Nomurabacteria bacterium RIFCSPLOWO2_01_FULL_46_18 TaxID=1801783 RepID=A0A1F6XBQ2_9BACT|nr:MAG: hypothetical protein A2933_02640 [Candidatus Nomurabacteria bacterium RIFCSPLOWO2_01_FULL_46_18]